MSAATVARVGRRLLARRRIEPLVRAFLALTTVLLLCATVLHRDDADGFQASHLFFMPRHTWEMDQGRGMLYEEAYYVRMDLEVLAGEVYGRYSEREYEREERPPIERAAPAALAPTSTAAYREWLAAQRQAYTVWFAEHRGEYSQWLITEATTFEQWLALQPAEYVAAHDLELAENDRPANVGEQPPAADSLSSGGHTQGQTVRRAPHAPAPGGSQLPIMGATDELPPPVWQFEPVSLPERSPISRKDDTPSPPPRPADSL